MVSASKRKKEIRKRKMPDEIMSYLEGGSLSALVEPVAYDTNNIPEPENSEILKIAEDVLDAAKYAYASVAAKPEQEVRSDSLEDAFKDSFGLMDDAKRDSIRKVAAKLTALPASAREEIFGRYGAMDSKKFVDQGFDRADEDLEPLELDLKLLGIRTPVVSMPTSAFMETPEGLLLPKEDLPIGFEEFETDFEDAENNAIESGVHSEENLTDIWGPAFAEDPFEMDTSEFEEEEFEEQAVRDNLAFYITKVKCVDETNPEWWGHDEIAIAGLSIDEDGDVKKISEKYVGGGFDDGDTKCYRPPWKYHSFSLREGKGWPKQYFMTLLLAEKDCGGFSRVLAKLWKAVKDKVWAAIDKIVGKLPGWWKLVGKIVAAAVKWVINKLIGWIVKVFKDDVFPPATVAARIWSFRTRWRHPDGKYRTYSPRRRAHFYGHKGHYYVEYYWRMRA